MKPDDIEQWAWDEAEETTYDIDTDRYGSIEYTAARIGIARLVMRVRSQAFEESAKIADGYAVEPDPDEQDPYDEWEMGNRSAAKRISQAIRQHSQKGRDK